MMFSLKRCHQLALLAVAVVLVATAPSGALADSCHLREFDLCMASATVFIQQPAGAKVTPAEVEKQCNLFKETESCLSEFEDKCMTKAQNSMVDFMSGGVLRYMREYCKKGGKVQKGYLKHGECINNQRKAINKCLIDMQAAIEKATDKDSVWKNRPKTMCCAMDRMNECDQGIVEPACGKEAVEVQKYRSKAMFSRGVEVSCTKYDHKSDLCKALLPPKGTVPKGAKSTSTLSKFISTMTQS